MATSKDTLDYYLELLSDIPDLHAKAMFGEYGLYSGDRMFALACDNQLFFKTFPETLNLFEDTSTKAYPGSRNTAPANADWLEMPDELTRVARLTIELTPPAKPKKKSC